jgi:hypothetical protein
MYENYKSLALEFDFVFSQRGCEGFDLLGRTAMWDGVSNRRFIESKSFFDFRVEKGQAIIQHEAGSSEYG